MKAAMMAPLLMMMFSVVFVEAHTSPALESFATKPILADLNDLRALNIPILAKDEFAEVGYALITPIMQQRIQEYAHTKGKCGGFEDLSQDEIQEPLKGLARLKQVNEIYTKAPFKILTLEKNESLVSAIAEIKEDNLKYVVQWLSSFPNRDNRAAQPNIHVQEMKTRLEAMLAESRIPYEISLIDHVGTKQKTVKVRLPGSERPNEIVVLGGHLDSINTSWGGGRDQAPGADDNASGSANLVEALRIVSQKAQPKRSIEFFWYAGEESGLLGSAEIAKSYKNQNADVIAVLQLDMTLFPGSGALVIGNMTDFTSSWLHDYLKAANALYIGARIVDDKCGYGCSDHASWHRQGYPTLMPFEAKMRDTNSNIHTPRDLITKDANFNHSAAYTKIALVFAMDLANSSARQPY